jgi:hypothetical protein
VYLVESLLVRCPFRVGAAPLHPDGLGASSSLYVVRGRWVYYVVRIRLSSTSILLFSFLLLFFVSRPFPLFSSFLRG